MSNGLGAGFFAVTMLAVLAGLALLVVLTTVVAGVSVRRTGDVPRLLRYLLAAVGVAVLVVSGFGVLALVDEAPVVAWMFAAIAVVPLLAVGGYLERTTALSHLDVAATTVMAWGLPFVPGVLVVFGVMNGIGSALELAPAESRRLGIPWLAATAGGLAIGLGMVPLGTRLGGTVATATESREGG